VTTKLWNTNHRPERVEPEFEASRNRLMFDYMDLYLIHTPFAFQPGDNQDPRDGSGNIVYDHGVALLDVRLNSVLKTGSPGFIPRGK
jgi:alcohol dehydrogenase (NADP+)